MKEEIRHALSDGSEKTARELFAIIAPENIQRLHEALSAMKKSGEIENGDDRQPGEPGGLTGRAAKPVKTYRLADIDVTGSAVERVPRPEVEVFDVIEGAGSSRNRGASTWVRDATEQLARQARAEHAPIVETEEWAPDAARSSPSIDEVEMTERYRDAEEVDEDQVVTLIHGHEELMLTYADRLAGNDPVWALMRQQYQAMLEL